MAREWCGGGQSREGRSPNTREKELLFFVAVPAVIKKQPILFFLHPDKKTHHTALTWGFLLTVRDFNPLTSSFVSPLR